MKWMEIDQDYLRTGTAIGSPASHVLCFYISLIALILTSILTLLFIHILNVFD